jgi:hypothetical protein
MDEADEIYSELIAFLRERLPSVADQIEDEVGQGRPLEISGLSTDERFERSKDLSDRGLQRLANSDLVDVPFSADERLVVLIAALRTLASTMSASRAAVTDLLDRRGDSYATRRTVSFGREGQQQARVVLGDELNGRRELDRTESELARVLVEIR